MSSTMETTYRKVLEEASRMQEIAQNFVQEHPILTGVVCVVLALGVLWLLFPWVIEALGFTEMGPLEGTARPDHFPRGTDHG